MRPFKSLLILFLLLPSILKAQDVEKKQPIEIDYNSPKTYIIGGIKVDGIKYLNANQIISVTGLREGDSVTIPSEALSSTLKRIWLQKAFSSVGLYVDSLSAAKDTAFLRLELVERPRVIRWDFQGVKSGERDDLKEKLNLRRGGELSEYVKSSSTKVIKDYYKEKGFLNVQVDVLETNDSIIKNAVKVVFDVKKGAKVKVKTITYEGAGEITKFKLDKSMKKTKDMKWYNFFSSKKFNESEYEKDKQSLLDVFNEAGYRDARILQDSIYTITDGRIGIKFKFDQGQRYYFRNITWTGNSEYTAEELNSVLGIEKGSIYDVISMQERLFGGAKEGEMNISKLYRDQGYLFFNVVPVELNIDGDSVDVEMRMVEGKPATFNNIIVNGNTITNDKVVRRAVFTRPGYLFRQTDFERSIREIASMGHFDPEVAADPNKGYNLIPNPMDNTVDIAYNVEEKANSQLELSGGWGANTFVGTVGVSFNNFSTHNFFKKEAWRPVPLGDAQTLSIRFQTNGSYYTALTANFVEPWLTGKKPTSLNISAYFTRQTNSYSTYYYQVLNDDEYMEIFGAAIGLGTRLKWPDNYFVLYNQLGWQSYKLQDWSYNFIFKTGLSHNISWTTTLSRNSTDQSIYPRSGADLSMSIQLTPPFSLFRDRSIDYNSLTVQEHYNWIEYHKWTFKGTLYTKLIGDLVLMTRAQFGYLGFYNKKWGYSPFEGFILGGDGMSGYNTYGSEVIGLRGYENYSLTPYINSAYAGNVYDKFTVELRYPVVLQPSSTIFALVFLEGGNCWSDIRDFNPFQIKRSAGVGLRVYLPVVGMLGIDWGYGFDADAGADKGQFHFVIGQQF
ncbi:MAG: POTRA domain-containing protein [Bacteroidales bacterium]|nr:POTRA domain-containing protein [Bacteroidales bacterium]MDD3200878.1 POTRA domain-containing protein [Bacteroidales bacterium]